MKPLALCLLLCLVAGCAGDSRRGDLAADNRDYFAVPGPVHVEKPVEAPQLSQAAGVQVGKAEAEANALKLENGDLQNDVAFLKAEKSTLLSEISLVKADNLKLTGVQMDNARLQNEIAAVKIDHGKLLEANTQLQTKIAADAEAHANAQVAWKASVENLKQQVQAGRDAYQQNVQFNEKHVEAMKNEQTAHLHVVYVFCSAIVLLVKLGAFVVCRLALGSRDRAYRRAGEAPLIEKPASWWRRLPFIVS